jgi:uncharacterized protein YegP (UPF0339 family)
VSAPSHFEVVHTGPRKFHARFVAGNGETVWVTESYTTRRSAHEAIAIIVLLAAASKDRVREVDARPKPPPPAKIEPPYYHRTIPHYTRDGRRTEVTYGDYWHDRSAHYENCMGDECAEGMPPRGAEVWAHNGKVTFTAAHEKAVRAETAARWAGGK